MAAEPEKTFQHQESLPSLPVPDLGDTLNAYVETIKPFVNDVELEHTKALCEDFKNGVGKELQEVLEERAASNRNWLEDWWETLGYLQPRYPCAVNVNWHGILPGNWGPTDMTQCQMAGIFVSALLTFRKRMLIDQDFPCDKMGGQPLCMYQFTRMFNSCQVPGDECDTIEEYEGARHIAVLRNDAVFIFDALDANGALYPTAHFVRQMEKVREVGSTTFDMQRNPPVSVLTSENRSKWSKARDHLVSLSARNEESLKAVETALIVVSLDKNSPVSDDEIVRLTNAGNGRDKWFDKPLTMIVFENCRSGLNGNHGWADAIAAVKLMDWATSWASARYETELVRTEALERRDLPGPVRLEWDLDADATTAIESASANISKLIAASDLSSMTFLHFGNSFIKRYNLVPDSFVQMAVQLAFYRLHGRDKPVAVYESAHTRLFYHGRTETIRSCSVESLAFVDAMMDPRCPASDRWDALRAAVKTHITFAKKCLMGNGVDRHLIGLQVVSEMMGGEGALKPALFTDRAFLDSKRFVLSTSNITISGGQSPIWGGFNAACEDGYGACYAIKADRITFALSAYHTCAATSTASFKAALEGALIEMRELCLTRDVVYIGRNPKL